MPVGTVTITESETKPIIGTQSEATKARASKEPAYWGMIGRFPRAILEIARISASGTKKHQVPISDMSYLGLPIETFDDAIARHQAKLMIEGSLNLDPKDHEGYPQGHKHRGHIAWNALAALEKELYEAELAAASLSVSAEEEKKKTYPAPAKKPDWKDQLPALINEAINCYPAGATMSSNKLATLIAENWRTNRNEIIGHEPVYDAIVALRKADRHPCWNPHRECWASNGSGCKMG